MKTTLIVFACNLVLACHFNSDDARRDGANGDVANDANLKTDEQKTLYALGLMLGRNLSSFNLKPDQLEIVKAGIADQTLGRTPKVDLQAYASKVSDLARTGRTANAKTEKAKGKAYADKAAKEPGAETTTSGLIYIPLKEGHGDSPRPTDVVRVQYRGTLVDGSEFDSSREPAELGLDRVVPCWTEGLQKMKPGGKATLVCPAALAYGELARPKIPAGSTLVFDIELLEVKPSATAISTKPADGAPSAPHTHVQVSGK